MWCIGEMKLPYVRHDIGHKYKGTETDFSIHSTQTLQEGAASPLWQTGATG